MKQVCAAKRQILDLGSVQFELSETDLLKVCRDLARSEMATMPGIWPRLWRRLLSSQANGLPDWSPNWMALYSLACMKLATTASAWCNANDAGFEDIFPAKRNCPDWAAAMLRARSAGASGFVFSTFGVRTKESLKPAPNGSRLVLRL